MSSINPHFTFQYVQPEDYHFSHDSVFLARRSFEILQKQNLNSLRVLDLCAGSGVVGLDFLFHARQHDERLVEQIHFVEVQNIYTDYFFKNCENAGMSLSQIRWIVDNYAAFSVSKEDEKFDVILSNPPYFRLGQGKLSPSEFKNRCRFFIDSSFECFLLAMVRNLKKDGQAFFLLRDLRDHGFDSFAEAQAVVRPYGSLKILEDIRGTGMIQLKLNTDKIP